MTKELKDKVWWVAEDPGSWRANNRQDHKDGIWVEVYTNEGPVDRPIRLLALTPTPGEHKHGKLTGICYDLTKERAEALTQALQEALATTP